MLEKDGKTLRVSKSIGLLNLLFLFGLVSGCASPFLQKEEVSKLSGIEKQQTTVIYFQKQFRFSSAGSLEVTSHKVIKVGSNTNAIPDLVGTTDSPIYKLKDFAGRIIKRNGDIVNLDDNNLITANQSNKNVITETVTKMLRTDYLVENGDMIEEVDVHVDEIPETGIGFSLDEIGSAENIRCLIDVPNNLAIYYKVINDSSLPAVDSIAGGREYVFSWKNYTQEEVFSPLSPRDNAPEIIAAVRDSSALRDEPFSWKEFGDWYLNLIKDRTQYDSTVKKTTMDVTKGLSTDKQKMDAIFNYCQKNIRYEQVYLNRGEEFIPHDCTSVLAKKYGDCKDYSCLIYAMANSIGLQPNLAICFRGRGYHFFPDMPVDQFNHVMVHFEDNGTDLWYDGTDEEGIPGMVSSDLINQYALVLEKGKSSLMRIKESEDDLLSVVGDLTREEDGFEGKLSIELKDQYAVDLLYAHSQLNETKMQEATVEWIAETLNPAAQVEQISWKTKPNSFLIESTVEIPNSASTIGSSVYSSLRNLFPRLFPCQLAGIDTTEVYYFPYYDRVQLRLNIESTAAPQTIADSTKGGGQVLDYRYEINPGPIDSGNQQQFKEKFHEISGAFNRTIKLKSEN